MRKVKNKTKHKNNKNVKGQSKNSVISSQEADGLKINLEKYILWAQVANKINEKKRKKKKLMGIYSTTDLTINIYYGVQLLVQGLQKNLNPLHQ